MRGVRGAARGQSAYPQSGHGFVAEVIYHPLGFHVKLSVPKTTLQFASFLRMSPQSPQISNKLGQLR